MLEGREAGGEGDSSCRGKGRELEESGGELKGRGGEEKGHGW